MKIVDETENIREIEEKIGRGFIEELIFQAHNQLKLILILKKWDPWDELEKYQKEAEADGYFQVELNQRMFAQFNILSKGSPDVETYSNIRHDMPPRPSTTGPESKDTKK